ncbi:MAG TPA: GH92 family glycosyl hydrolase [Holophagaceae bacterium]|nr:GH92 family glycosyl hydrolase [Holophagaceae bacterium]
MKLLAALLLCAVLSGGDRDPARFVDPRIGTGGHGHTFPGPSLPFGMIQPGPDTRLTGWDGCSGYHAGDRVIYGFSHTHLSGTGCSDYGDVLLLPATGQVKLASGYRFKGEDPLPFDPTGYGSSFDKATETAEAGYYAVTLADYGVRAEVTSTLRTALHRWTFTRAENAHVVLDLTHRGELLASEIRVVDAFTVEGFRRTKAWATDRPVYFRIRFDRPFHPLSGSHTATAALAFDLKDGDVLQAQVSISAVDLDGAKKNLAAEQKGFHFDALRARARVAWNAQLAKVEVEGASDRDRRIFTTALYHTFLQPNLFQDVDGRYLGRDLKVHKAEGFRNHTVFSLWDTFRAAHPLYTLLEPKRSADFVNTFLAQFRQGGRLPVWELWGNETDCMIGYHSVSVIADAYAKGLRGFDAKLALKAMVASADADRFGLAAYRAHGYIPGDAASESVSRTLEYAYDDACIARFAEALGEKELAARFFARAQAWRNLLDPEGHLRPREKGRWVSPFNPTEVSFHFTEANGWQYGFFVPQDFDGFMARLGGPEAFAQLLDRCFAAESRTTGREQADITGLVGQYAHGNEPSHHMAYLWVFAGQPWKTQAMVRRLMDGMYTDQPDGLIGNEDCGQMSAWYVMSALGFYAVTPGTPDYVIGAPRFPKLTLHLENGKVLTICAEGEGPYVQSLAVDGRSWTKAWLPHGVLAKGGELRFRMGTAPATWGSAPEDRPRTSLPGPGLVPAPVAEAPLRFRTTAEVKATCPEPVDALVYTLDGSDPGADSPRWTGALTVDRSLVLKLRARRGDAWSAVTEVPFVKLDPRQTITLKHAPHPQYRAGGDDALLDGVRGGADFRLGAWQGFYGEDLEAVVDLGEAKALHKVSVGFLQDQNSWIFMPTALRVEGSADGATWTRLGEAVNAVDPHAEGALIRDLAVKADGTFRYLRLVATSPVTCPDWHKGRGNRCFIFADEIQVE